MNVSLTPQLEKFINKQVKTGQYQTASEVVREALRLMAEHKQSRAEKLRRLRKELHSAFEEIERGDGIPATDEFFESIKRRGRERLDAMKRKKSA